MGVNDLIKLIGFVPQTSQVLFVNKGEHYFASAPFESFSISLVEENFDLDDIGIVYQTAYFENQKDLLLFSKNLHLIEIVQNGYFEKSNPNLFSQGEKLELNENKKANFEDITKPINNSNELAIDPIVKNYLIDIGGTICDEVPNEEPERMVICEPYPDAIDILNKWYDEGHIITFFTSRTELHREITETWLKKYGVKYHGLLFGKPRGGNYHWIDNQLVKATRFKGKYTNLIKLMPKIKVFEP